VPAVAEDELLALEENTGESDDVIGDEGGWMNLIEQKAAEKKIIVIAGPNGAGKTTFAGEFLPKEAHCPAFVNADLIAAGLAPFDPERAAFRAGRLMLEEIHSHVRRGASFAFETTLSGRGYAALLPRWQAQGYIAKLFFLRLASPELAIARVRQRVREGGHNIPEPVIRRRFASGLRNFETLYKPLADEWALYDNSGGEPVLIDEGVKS
jgi:predicted ABC-type ATPase